MRIYFPVCESNNNELLNFIRELGKKINALESEFDVTCNSLLANETKVGELDKELGKHEEEISALNRRQQLLEGENKQTDEKVKQTKLEIVGVELKSAACHHSS